MKQAVPPARFAPGPSVRPSSALLKWLNSQTRQGGGRRKLLRMPVVVRFPEDSRLQIKDAFIGGPETDQSNDTIFLTLDDTGMSDSLLSQLNDLCPKPAAACAVWLEGMWGTLVEPDLLGLTVKNEAGEVTAWPFAVLRLLGLIKNKAEVGDPGRVWVEEKEI